MHGSLAMGRAGRKRKPGANRYESGRAIPPNREPDDRIRTSRQPHRKGLPNPLDERGESVLGRLLLNGHITERQYEAGCMYVAISAAYKAVACGPSSGIGTGRGTDCNPQECLAMRQLPEGWPCACREVSIRYDRAYWVLRSAGRRPAIAVEAVAIHGQEPYTWPILYLHSGLNALSNHFGL